MDNKLKKIKMKTDKEKQREIWRKASLRYYYRNKEDCLKRTEKYRNKEKDNERNRVKFSRLYREDKDFKKKRLLREKHQYHVKKEFCVKCSSKENLEIHHLDYNKLNAFQVLCRKCHREVHHGK